MDIDNWDVIAHYKSAGTTVTVWKTDYGPTVVETDVFDDELEDARELEEHRSNNKIKVAGKKSKVNYPNGIGPTKRLLYLVQQMAFTKATITKTDKDKLIGQLKQEGYGQNGSFYPASYWDAVYKELKWK